MKGYKGFNSNLCCLDKQYEVGKTFEEERAEICCKGMHFCANPLEVLNHYSLIGRDGKMNRFAEVEALDEALTDDDKKYCTKKLKIGAELSLKGFIKASFDFLWDKCYEEPNDSEADNSQLASSGYNSQLASSGYNSQLASSGDNSQLASSGYNSKLASSGDYSKLASSGYNSKLASSGYNSKLASSGDNSQLASSGDNSQLASSGYNSKLASSGDYSKLASSGDYSQLASSGDYSRMAIEGKNSAGACLGRNSKIKGKIGTWITIASYDEKGVINCVKSAQIDGTELKEDVFYRLKDGEFVEVEED